MVQIINKTLSLEDFLNLPETKPANEYINGQIIQKPMPQGKLVTVINNMAEDGDIANSFNAHPDWTIEILSLEQSTIKLTTNILHCLNSGCQMGWLIVPEEKSIFVYPSGQQPIFLDELDAVIPVPQFIYNLTLTLGDILSWLKVNPS